MAYQYPDLLGPIERGQRMKIERDRARMEAEKFLLDQAEARRLADYNERMLRVNEGREARMVADAALALERERRFNELYQQNLSRFTGTPEKSTETWGYVGPRREPTWREQQDAYTRAAMGSGNLNMVSDIFSARAREELSGQQFQNRAVLEEMQNRNRIEVERIKQEAAIERLKVNRASDPRLGYFNVYDELTLEPKGRVYFSSIEERNRWLAQNGIGAILRREGSETDEEIEEAGEPGQYEPAPDIEAERKLAQDAIRSGVERKKVAEMFKARTGQEF